MKTKHQYLLFFYWVALLADCYFIYEQKNSDRLFSKGILMPLLILYYLVNSAGKHHRPSRLLTISALLLAWAGDLFLLRSGEQSFIIGLVLFLTMHVLYLVYFARIHAFFPVKKPLNVWLPLIVIGIYDAVLMNTLLQDADARKLQVPLIAYMVILSLMFVFACNVRGSKKAGSLALPYFIPGATLFVISDSLLGLNMYVWEEQVVGIAVMLTYGYAQHLMVHGFIKHVKGRT